MNGKSEPVTTSTLAAVADIIDSVKDIVSWLDRRVLILFIVVCLKVLKSNIPLVRSPFEGHEPYLEMKSTLLKICLELATNAQRDLFAEQPVQVRRQKKPKLLNTLVGRVVIKSLRIGPFPQVIRNGCSDLAGLTYRIIQESNDPLVLQPASLDVATVKKKPEDDLVVTNCHTVSTSGDGIDLWIQVNLAVKHHSVKSMANQRGVYIYNEIFRWLVSKSLAVGLNN